jgi:hypothetical protein
LRALSGDREDGERAGHKRRTHATYENCIA